MFQFTKVMTLAATMTLAVASASEAQVLYARNNTNLTKATEAMMSGDLEKASTYFRRAVKANLGEERMVLALNNYCAVEYALGNFESAENICTKAIGEDRHYWRAYVNRGNARRELGNVVEAKADYSKALRLKPSSRIAKAALASVTPAEDRLLADLQQ